MCPRSWQSLGCAPGRTSPAKRRDWDSSRAARCWRISFAGRRKRSNSMKLLEREAFLKDLKGWLTEATAGTGRLVFVAGEAGIGKTVLLRIFAQAVEGIARVAVGACDPLSTPRPPGPLLDVGELAAHAPRRLDAGRPRR